MMPQVASQEKRWRDGQISHVVNLTNAPFISCLQIYNTDTGKGYLNYYNVAGENHYNVNTKT